MGDLHGCYVVERGKNKTTDYFYWLVGGTKVPYLHSVACRLLLAIHCRDKQTKITTVNTVWKQKFKSHSKLTNSDRVRIKSKCELILGTS